MAILCQSELLTFGQCYLIFGVGHPQVLPLSNGWLHVMIDDDYDVMTYHDRTPALS